MYAIGRFLKRIYRNLESMRYVIFVRIAATFFAMFSLCVFAITQTEGQVHPPLKNPLEAIFFLTTMSIVGFGEYYPSTTGGKIVVFCITICMLTFVALFSAAMAAYFVQSRLKEERGMGEFHFSNHIVFVGWNLKGYKVLEMIRQDPDLASQHVVIVAKEEKKPEVKGKTMFVSSDSPTKRKDLLRANIQKASRIILLANYSVKEASDAITAVNCLMARKLNDDAKIVAEILNSKSRDFMQLSGADEIIGVSEIGGILIAECAIDVKHENEAHTLQVITEHIHSSHNDDDAA